MEQRVASILLILSVAGGLLAAAEAASSGDADTIIRLPSNSNGEEDDRPWECCDNARCTRKHPPSCQCLDRVDKCSDACKECVLVEFGSEVCADWYRGTPPPRCHDESQQTNRIVHVMKEARKKDGDDDERPPWKCCNRVVPGPSTTTPPVWYCMDKFDSCDCERCFEVKDDSNSKSYFCLDGYKGTDPGPSCTHDG